MIIPCFYETTHTHSQIRNMDVSMWVSAIERERERERANDSDMDKYKKKKRRR